jgi:hypothetical protein
LQLLEPLCSRFKERLDFRESRHQDGRLDLWKKMLLEELISCSEWVSCTTYYINCIVLILLHQMDTIYGWINDCTGFTGQSLPDSDLVETFVDVQWLLSLDPESGSREKAVGVLACFQRRALTAQNVQYNIVVDLSDAGSDGGEDVGGEDVGGEDVGGEDVGGEDMGEEHETLTGEDIGEENEILTGEELITRHIRFPTSFIKDAALEGFLKGQGILWGRELERQCNLWKPVCEHWALHLSTAFDEEVRVPMWVV